MFVAATWVSGLMFGVEYLWEESIVVLDLGIVRLYIGKAPKGNDNVS